jgi:hypothetical protein
MSNGLKALIFFSKKGKNTIERCLKAPSTGYGKMSGKIAESGIISLPAGK